MLRYYKGGLVAYDVLGNALWVQGLMQGTKPDNVPVEVQI